MISTFGTAVEITASELSIESFFPADRATAAAMLQAAALRGAAPARASSSAISS